MIDSLKAMLIAFVLLVSLFVAVVSTLLGFWVVAIIAFAVMFATLVFV